MYFVLKSLRKCFVLKTWIACGVTVSLFRGRQNLEKIHRSDVQLSERIAFLGIMGDPIEGPPETLWTSLDPLTFFNGLWVEVICCESCIYLEFLTRWCCSWNSGKFYEGHSLLLEWNIVSFRLACFVIYSFNYFKLFTRLIWCSFVWLLLFVCSAIFVFYSF